MFVLFLNPRPQFRVKEHSDSVLPPLPPSAKHKNQNLHTYMALILDLGGTGCQYSRESRADRPSHPALLWAAAVPFGEHCAQGAKQAQPAFFRGEAAPPWRGPLHSQGWAPRGEQLFPKGAGVVDAKGFPNRLRRTRHSSPTPRTPVCRAHPPAAPRSATRARSPPSYPGTQTAGRRIFSLTVFLLVRPFYVSFPPHYKHLHPSLSARGQKTSRTRDPQG